MRVIPVNKLGVEERGTLLVTTWITFNLQALPPVRSIFLSLFWSVVNVHCKSGSVLFLRIMRARDLLMAILTMGTGLLTLHN